MTTELTPQQHLAAVRHLAGGKDLDVVATILHTTREIVLDAGSKHGYPDKAKLAWAADILEKKLEEADAPKDHPDAASILRDQHPSPIRPAAGASTPPAAGPPVVDELHTLVDAGKQHPSKRIQAAANKVLDDLDRLRTLLREDHEKNAEKRKADAAKAAARAEVERLKAELAAAQAKLRGPGHKPATSTTDGPPAAEVRAWATQNGIECTAVGRVPSSVREAYEAAHTQQAS